jgi:hypothetical protein
MAVIVQDITDLEDAIREVLALGYEPLDIDQEVERVFVKIESEKAS